MVDGGARSAAGVVPHQRRSVIAVAHGVAGGIVVAGVAVQVLRPLAPDFGPPPPPTEWFDPAHLARAHAYRHPLYAAGLAAFALRLAVPCLAAFTRTGRRVTNRLVGHIGDHRPARAAAAVIVAVVVAADVVVLPLAFWAGYVHEGAFGFRTQGLAGWGYDWLIAKVPAWLLLTVVVLAGYALARRLPRAWPPVLALVGAAFTVFLVFATPVIVQLLVFHTEPLPPGPLRTEVERILDRSDMDVDRILLADASRRTTKRNAYIAGLGPSRQVVLYDTLVDTVPPDEVGVVVAHELGHAEHADIVRGTLFAAAGVVTVVYLLAAVCRRRTVAGRQRSVTDPRAAAVVLAVVVLANAVSVPVQNAVSRRAEAAADAAALRLTGAPETYVRLQDELSRANLTDPSPPRWAMHLWSTHPPPSARLHMGLQWAAGPGG